MHQSFNSASAADRRSVASNFSSISRNSNISPSNMTSNNSNNNNNNAANSQQSGRTSTAASTLSSAMSWVCPSDRQLMLRAMLGAGWSNRSRDPSSPLKGPNLPGVRDAPVPLSNNGNDSPAREAITEEEKRHIADILKKAEQSKRLEQTRIESLKSRVQSLKIQTRGDGYNSCLLCGEPLGLFKRSTKCDLCAQRFCDKCSGVHHSRSGAQVTLCRVCHEQREVWKRSGAWQNGDLPELFNEPPSRSVSILSNSSSTKGGVVDPNALLGQTGWRRYRSIHGHTTILKPGRTAVLSENADTDSESEFDANMIGGLSTPPMPIAPQTDHLPRKFPDNNVNTENTPATAPSSPTPHHHGTFYDQLSMRTEVASRFFSYAVSRIGWGAGEEKMPLPESYTPPPQSPPFKDGQENAEAPKPFPFTQPRVSNLNIDNNGNNNEVEHDSVPKPFPTFRQLFASPSMSEKVQPLDDGVSSASPINHILPASSSNRALSSPVAGSDNGWSKPSDDSNTDDAQSTTSSTAINAGATSSSQPHVNSSSCGGSRKNLTSSKPDLSQSSHANADVVSVKSLKIMNHDDNPSLQPAFDTTSVRSLDVRSSSGTPRATKSARPNSLHGAISGPICNTKPEKHASSSAVTSPCTPNAPALMALTPTKLAPAAIDRRRLSADIGRLLEPKSLPTSASSSKVALVIAASTATGFLAAPTSHSACGSALGPPPPSSTSHHNQSRLTENSNAPHKASTSDLSSPTSSMSSVSFSVSQRKLNQRDSNATAAESSDVDSDVAYQLPNGGPSIAITEPGNAPDGTLHFTLMYDTAASTLICRIILAKDLASKDMNGLSDPYVKVELLPDPCKASLVKTNVVKKCLNPTWDETIVYEGVLEEDMKAKTLRLQVLDKDPIGYDFIGETRTTLSCLPTDRLLSYNVVLKPAQKEPKLLSGAPLLDVGRIRLTFLYNSAESVFSVSGLRLARLARAGKKSNKDPPSPIIQIRLLVQSAPAATQPAFQTQMQRRCVNCNFGAGEIFKEKISLKELAKRVVDISVWDGHVSKADCLLGSVQFGITSHGHQLRHFYQAVKTTDIAHTRWHAITAPPGASLSGASSGGAGAPPSPSPSRSTQSTSSRDTSSPMVVSKRFQ